MSTMLPVEDEPSLLAKDLVVDALAGLTPPP
jgi:hypothetical protein